MAMEFFLRRWYDEGVFAKARREVSALKHVDLINRIIEAEQKAQQLAGQARDKKLHLHEELRESAANMRQTYFDRANHRIDSVRERENSQNDEKIMALTVMQNLELANMETTFLQHRDEWIEKLFSMIVDR